MEASLSSSGNKSLVPKGTQDTTREESGWTAYFDDFLSNQREHSSCSDAFCSPSLVSDAASYVVWNNDIPSNNQVLPTSSSMADSPNYPKKLNFKKTRSKEITYDESLEDTASSPLNSPKRKVGGCGNFPEMQADERNEMNFEGKSTKDSVDLKKKGMYLVPLSMLVNYLG
ncbi:unnamed protein product [Ilex paraguariensis]|uniref:Uncharacterized protein n=1 Tax=Ilex paraguariensis TaxID=185542 RepID=A0ABC8QLL4_9AQUA